MKIRISTRLVLLIGKYVYKFPISKRGYLQGKNETKIWYKYKYLNLLGYLHWEYFGIVCMKRYEPCIQIPEHIVTSIKKTISEFDIDNCDLYNHKNWGVEQNKYYLIDYGINEYISKLYK